MSQLFVTACTNPSENQEHNILVSVTKGDGKPTQGLKKRNFKVSYLFGDGSLNRRVVSVKEGPNGFYGLKLNPLLPNEGSPEGKIAVALAIAVTTYGNDVKSRPKPSGIRALVPKDHGQTIAVGELDDIGEL